jgi:hypothetical protein
MCEPYPRWDQTLVRANSSEMNIPARTQCVTQLLLPKRPGELLVQGSKSHALKSVDARRLARGREVYAAIKSVGSGAKPPGRAGPSSRGAPTQSRVIGQRSSIGDAKALFCFFQISYIASYLLGGKGVTPHITKFCSRSEPDGDARRQRNAAGGIVVPPANRARELGPQRTPPMDRPYWNSNWGRNHARPSCGLAPCPALSPSEKVDVGP